ncbi:MAG: lysophospholipid transporter LplT [Gammaproteobacteria bacterium]|nr:lysophospholipid transporter LplT [Gammaproteobacteria bacterium]
MIPVLIAQFLSALADNMLLFVILGLIKQQEVAEWVTPVLQQTFLVAYIVLAPFVGAFADGFSKGRVMLFANTLKFLAVAFLLVGGNPFLAYGMVGIGACIYSPAKYGILKEIKEEEFLVKANAMIEGSTMAAILTGVVLGGKLADYAVASGSFTSVIMLVAGIYLCASAGNLFIPKLPAIHKEKIHVRQLMGKFIKDFKTLWNDFSSRITLMGTGVFFGVGATMRFLLIAWVPQALGIMDNATPAEMNAIVAVGIVIGTGLASRIPLRKAYRVLSAGVGMGIGLIMLSQMTNIYAAYAWLVVIGICGGLFVVPLNALLQKQGHELVGGGHAVAIQNFVENTTMLIMLSIYMGLAKTGLSAVMTGTLFGMLVVAMMLALRFYGQRGVNKGRFVS